MTWLSGLAVRAPQRSRGPSQEPIDGTGDDAHGRAPRLLVRASRTELDPGQGSKGHQQQPRGEQDVNSEVEDDHGHDGKDDEGDDRGHGDRSPFMSQ